MKTAILAGATGLIGSKLLELLLNEDAYGRVVALSRKKLTVSNAKLLNIVVDFDNLQNYSSLLKGDDVFCCLGTTIKEAGSKDAFRKVDYDYPVSLAKTTHQEGALQFLLVSSLGANKNSSIFYNRVKGEVQEAVGKMEFEGLHIFQPSLLLGPRVRKRTGEYIGKAVMNTFGFFIPKKYKAIESAKVARAMMTIANRQKRGTFIYESDELQSF